MSLAEKGKAKDESTNWSAWIWDVKGFWYAYRRDRSGELVYEYKYPEASLDTHGARVGQSSYADANTHSHSITAGDGSVIISANGNLSITGNVSITTANGKVSFKDPEQLVAPFGSLGFGVKSKAGSARAAASVTQFDRQQAGTENLGQVFEVVREPSRFFKLGRVFKTMWSEPAGDVQSIPRNFLRSSTSGDEFFSKVRHFVVVKEANGYSLCIQLSTHGGKGAAKLGAQSADYAPVYPAGGMATILPNENITLPSFPIIVENPTETIDSSSRLNLGKIYTVEHSVKVVKVGRIQPESLPLLQRLYYENATGVPHEDQANKRMIHKDSNSGDYEKLDTRYRVVPENKSRQFWRPGRVFMMLWTEPAGPPPPKYGAIVPSSALSTVRYGGMAYSEIRRFVVLRDNYGSAICSAIHTYSGRGTLKKNLPDPGNHAIIYTSREPPPLLVEKDKNGKSVTEELYIDAIKVNGTADYGEGKLHPASRLNFTKLYTVEKNLPVLNIGVVSAASMVILSYYSPVKIGSWERSTAESFTASESSNRQASDQEEAETQMSGSET